MLKDDYRQFTVDEMKSSVRQPVIMKTEYGHVDTNLETRPKMELETTTRKYFEPKVLTSRPIVNKPISMGASHLYGAESQAKMETETSTQVQYRGGLHGSKLTASPAMRSQSTESGIYTNINKTSNNVLNKDPKVIGRKSNLKLRPIPVMPDTRQKSFKPDQTYKHPQTEFSGRSSYASQYNFNKDQALSAKRSAMIPVKRNINEDIKSSAIQNSKIYDTEYSRTFENKSTSVKEFLKAQPKQLTDNLGKFNRKKALYNDKTLVDSEHKVNKSTFKRMKPQNNEFKNLKAEFGNLREKHRFESKTMYKDSYSQSATDVNQQFNDVRNHRVTSIKPKDLSHTWYKIGGENLEKLPFKNDYTGAFAPPATICRPKVRDDKFFPGENGRLETEYHKRFNSQG